MALLRATGRYPAWLMLAIRPSTVLSSAGLRLEWGSMRDMACGRSQGRGEGGKGG